METIAQTWWGWMAFALVLAILEVFAPGFVFLGFAAGAALTSVLLLIGLQVSLPVLAVFFAALSLISWFAFRRLLPGSYGNSKIIEKDINDG